MTAVPWALPPRADRRPEPIDPVTRRKLLERAGGLDEVTGEPLMSPPDIHHRKKKSQGRDDSPSNLLVVSRRTHNRLGQHEAFARENGFVVDSWRSPADVALLLHMDRYVLLTDTFGYVDAERGPDGGAAA